MKGPAQEVTSNINVLTKFYMLNKGLTMSTRTQYFKLRGGILNECKKVLIASALFTAILATTKGFSL